MKKFAAIQRFIPVLCLSVVAFRLVSSAYAANPADWKTFTSITMQNWNDAANWTVGTGIPTLGDTLVINFDPSKPGTVNSSGKISQSFTSTNDLGAVQLNTLNLAGESSASARTISITGGMLQFSGTSPSINNTTVGVADTVKYTINSAIMLDADLELNLNGASYTTLLAANGATLSANSAGLNTLTVSGVGNCYLGGISTAVISDGSGQVGITMAGTGKLTMGGTNTFTGDLLVKSGTVTKNTTSAGNAKSFGAGTIKLGDPASGNTDAILQFTAGASGMTFTNPIAVQSGNSGTKTIDNPSGNFTATVGGLLTLNDNLTVTYSGGSGGLINLGSSATAPWITGASNLTFLSNGTGTGMGINGSNANFSGSITVQTGITLVKSAYALGAANAVALAANATFNINGLNQTIAGLNDVSGSGGSVTNTGAAKTLTLGGSGAYSFGGSIGGTNLALTVALTGGGTQTLGGTNTYSGVTTLNGGTLKLGTGGSLASTSITVNSGATLELTGSSSLLDNATLTLKPGGTAKLDTGVQEQIGVLVLNTATQANGTYGSTSSTAVTKDDTCFSGSGVLYVGVEPPPAFPKGTVISIR